MKTYELIVLGAGSGNMLLQPELAHLRTAIVEPDRFGGTCLNRGCIPSKMFVVAADRAYEAAHNAELGVQTSFEGVDWPAIRDRIFGRIDPIHQSGLDWRRNNGIDVYTDPARFVGQKTLQVGAETIEGETIVIAAGARPVIPPIPGLAEVEVHTSDTIMRLDRLPASMIILGGGFIAAEMGHVFASYGTEVTVIQRGPRLLMAEDEQISEAFTTAVAERFNLRLQSTVERVRGAAGGVNVSVSSKRGDEEISAEVLLVATGRQPNTDLLDVAAAGLAVDEHGHLVTDQFQRCNVEGVWALGDVSNHFQLKHMANAETRVVAHNLSNPDDLTQLRSRVAPHAVFSHPQVASFGSTQAELEASGQEFRVSVKPYSDTAYGWALEDKTSFVKLLSDPERRTLLGAHIIGPQAATLIQPLVQAMALNEPLDAVGRDVIYIHPALTEAVEQAILEL